MNLVSIDVYLNHKWNLAKVLGSKLTLLVLFSFIFFCQK